MSVPSWGPPVDVRGAAVLPGTFRVAEAAVTSVGAALSAAAAWRGARSVSLDAAAAAGVFVADRHLLVDGRAPQLWDPVAGDYPTSDGWVRLHTNYPSHRLAALRPLGLPPGAARAAVAAAVAGAVPVRRRGGGRGGGRGRRGLAHPGRMVGARAVRRRRCPAARGRLAHRCGDPHLRTPPVRA